MIHELLSYPKGVICKSMCYMKEYVDLANKNFCLHYFINNHEKK